MTKTSYKQRLPHFQPIGAIFFITFRLFGSIPFARLNMLRDEFEIKMISAKNEKDNIKRKNYISTIRQDYFLKFDYLLDQILHGPNYLAKVEIRNIVKEQLHKHDDILYDLICYSIMSNHVHLLIDTTIQLDAKPEENDLLSDYVQLDRIMKLIKGATSRYANKTLGISGQFWERENFDVLVRNAGMYSNSINYILNNPVKVGIADKWDLFPGNYFKYIDTN